jgi:hypothetical protein
MKNLILALAVVSVATCASASKEGILQLSSFRLESDGIGRSGKVVVEGKQDKDGRMVNLKVTAFGKDYLVPKEKLAQLGRITANGVRISYEAGYARLGGRTVYLQLQMGFVESTQWRRRVTVKENGAIEIEKSAVD